MEKNTQADNTPKNADAVLSTDVPTTPDEQGLKYLDEAIHYSQSHYFSKAINYFDRAESYFSSPGELKWLTYLQHERALVHVEMENFNDASYSYEQAALGYLTLMDFNGTALVMIHRSKAQFKENNGAGGRHYLKLAEYIIDSHHLDHLKGFLYSSLALYYFGAGRFCDAAEYYKRALLHEKQDTYNYAWYQSKLGIAYECIFVFDLAEQHLNLAYNLFLTLKQYKEVTEIMSRLEKLYVLRGKTGAAKDITFKMLNLNRHFITRN